MAKSVRSKSIRRHKAIRRADIFGPVEKERLDRLALKQSEIIAVERVEKEVIAEAANKALDVEKMEVDGRDAPLSKSKRKLYAKKRAVRRHIGKSRTTFN